MLPLFVVGAGLACEIVVTETAIRAAVEGTVTDPAGVPVRDVRIGVRFIGSCFVLDRSDRTLVDSVRTDATTDAQGEYSLERQRFAPEDEQCTAQALVLAIPPDSIGLRGDTVETEDAHVAVGTSPTLRADVQLEEEN